MTEMSLDLHNRRDEQTPQRGQKYISKHSFSLFRSTARNYRVQRGCIFLPSTLSAPFPCALVAQLDRASDYESEGRAFESLRARQSLPEPLVKLPLVDHDGVSSPWRLTAPAPMHPPSRSDVAHASWKSCLGCNAARLSSWPQRPLGYCRGRFRHLPALQHRARSFR